MNRIPSIRKILQSLYYLQSNAPPNNKDRFNRVYLLKMIYFADRYHLRHYGSLVTGDTYVAMKLGPVASITFDILKKIPCNTDSTEVPHLDSIKELTKYSVEIVSQCNDELSKSSKNAFDFALTEFGHFDWKNQSAISHCYPEWKKYETRLLNSDLSIPMDIQDFFDDPDDDACFSVFGKSCDPFKEDKEFLALLKEDFDTNVASF